MSLPRFAVTATPGGSVVTVNDIAVPVSRVVVEAAVDEVPRLTVWSVGEGTVEGEGVVQVVREPTQAEIDTAAIEALARVSVDEFTRRCEARIRAGRRDPYGVALDVLKELAGG